MKILLLGLMLVSACGARESSKLDGIPEDDPIVEEMREIFRSAEIGPLSLEAESSWDCTLREAMQFSNKVVNYNDFFIFKPSNQVGVLYKNSGTSCAKEFALAPSKGVLGQETNCSHSNGNIKIAIRKFRQADGTIALILERTIAKKMADIFRNNGIETSKAISEGDRFVSNYGFCKAASTLQHLN
jgi:hypothetical protein